MRIKNLEYEHNDYNYVMGTLCVVLEPHEAAKLFREVDESRTREFAIMPKDEAHINTMINRAISNSYYGMHGTVPKLKEVIFNEPATICIWSDGSKTIVKCEEGDIFDKEKGIALCFMKKINGNKGNYNNVFKKFIKEKGDNDE